MLGAAIAAAAFLCLPAQAQDGPAVCPDCDLSNQDFSGRTLTTPNFAGADLRGANFANTVIRGGNFMGANLTGAIFRDADIQADPAVADVPSLFQDALLQHADFSGATISAADFQYADLSCSVFRGVDVTAAVFGPRIEMDPAQDCAADFSGAALSCEFNHQIDRLNRDGATMPDCSVEMANGGMTGDLAPPAPAPAESGYGAAEGVVTEEKTAVSAFMAPAGRAPGAVITAAQTVHVAADGKDAAGCGTSLPLSCQTIAYGAAQCGSADCLVAVEYGEYVAAAPIAPAKGAITIAGGFVGGTQVDQYQSQITAPADGLPAFDLKAADGGIVLSHLLVVGTKPAAGKSPGQTVALRASGGALTLRAVNVLAAAGVTGAASADGAAGADGAKGGDGTSATAPGAGGASSCGAAGGTGGKNVSNTASSSLTWYLACELDCKTSWANGSSGQPGGTGSYAPGSTLSKGDALACYACPSGRGSLPKSAATGSSGANGSCGSGGTASTDTAGRFDANGVWTASAAGAGGTGKAGGGGGGGGPGGSCGYANCVCSSSAYAGGAGGGGGSGGCGAAPGAGGQPGAASFGIVLVNAMLAFDSDKNVVTGARSGDGAAGGAGKKGGAFGPGGKGKNNSDICNNGGASGAAGGQGGRGGASGGGAGGNSGPSVNIALISGAAITGTPVQYSGMAGEGGAKGAAGADAQNCTASAAADGVKGLVAEVHTF